MTTIVRRPPKSSSAILSDDGMYRYALCRRWDPDPVLFATFIMLNPSTADATEDDPTIRRCVGFAKSWGMQGLIVINLYALRATDPKELWTADDPVGPENNEFLVRYIKAAYSMGSIPVAAWGANAKPERVDEVLRLHGILDLDCLGRTKTGAPRHPLYLKSDTHREPW